MTSGYLVGIEKVDVFELAKQYPEAFGRPYDPDFGVLQDTWFVNSANDAADAAVSDNAAGQASA